RRSWWRCGRRGKPRSRRPAPGPPWGGPPAVRGSGHSHHVLIVGNNRAAAPRVAQEQQGASTRETHALKLLVAAVERGHERMHVEPVHGVLVALVVFPVAELGFVALAFGQIPQGHLLVLDVQHLADGPQVGVAISLGVGLVVVGPGDHALLNPGADAAWVDPGVGREVVDGIDRGFRHARCLHHTPSSCYTTPQAAIMLLVVHSAGDTIHEQRTMALPLLW